MKYIFYTFARVSLYIWNSYHDKKESPFISIGDDTISQRVEFIFSIGNDYKAGNFEVKEIEISTKKERVLEKFKVNPEESF